MWMSVWVSQASVSKSVVTRGARSTVPATTVTSYSLTQSAVQVLYRCCSGVVHVEQLLVNNCYLRVTVAAGREVQKNLCCRPTFCPVNFWKRSQFWHRPCRLVTYFGGVPCSDWRSFFVASDGLHVVTMFCSFICQYVAQSITLTVSIGNL